jgi:hypothetical protein
MLMKKYTYLLMIMALILLAGCRGGAKVITQAEGFDFEEMKQSSWAVGGVFLNKDFVPDGAAQKELQPFLTPWNGVSEVLSPMLYGGLLRVAPEMELWTFDTVFSRVPEVELKELAEELANSREPAPGKIKNLTESLAKVRYVVFARVDDTQLDTNEDMASSVVDQMNRDGREPHANTLARTVSIRRGVFMSMEVYDLQTGIKVWSGEADHWDEVLLTGEANEQSRGVQVLRDGEDSEVTQILLDGIMRNGPSLLAGIRETCAKLANEMNTRQDWKPGEENVSGRETPL